MKKYQVKINNMELEITQDDDGKFITPYLCIEDWGKFGTALKPSFEPIIVARKPFKGSCVDNVIKYGVGGINIDECRIETSEKRTIPINAEEIEIKVNGSHLDTLHKNQQHERVETNLGRFPANTILTYDDTDFEEVCGGFPNTKGEIGRAGRKSGGQYDASSYKFGIVTDYSFKDSGSAARYFYCAKASKKDRDEGLDEFEYKKTTDGCIRSNEETARKFGANSVLRKNTHPTVKPTSLMQYLVRLVTPRGGYVLDPFMGSGSTGKATMYENVERDSKYKFIGIELTDEYLPIANARIEYARKQMKETKDNQITWQDVTERTENNDN